DGQRAACARHHAADRPPRKRSGQGVARRYLGVVPRGNGRPPADQAQERHRIGGRGKRLMPIDAFPLVTLALLVALALAFDFMNGFHDAANSIATVVSTGVLKPYQAVVWAAFFNFL